MDAFIAIVMKNLEKNSFPQKRVSFDLELLYETAENKRLSLNNVLDEMRKRGVDHIKKGDKIIFFSAPEPDESSFFTPDMFAQAQEMMKNMSPEEQAATQTQAQEMLKNMSPEEQAQLFEQAKKMGML
jgi:hypothetical protein